MLSKVKGIALTNQEYATFRSGIESLQVTLKSLPVAKMRLPIHKIPMSIGGTDNRDGSNSDVFELLVMHGVIDRPSVLKTIAWQHPFSLGLWDSLAAVSRGMVLFVV